MTSAVGEGIYNEATNRATYGAMLERARLLLERGESVIVDTTQSIDACIATGLEVVGVQ